jgi:hypothetical protein
MQLKKTKEIRQKAAKETPIETAKMLVPFLAKCWYSFGCRCFRPLEFLIGHCWGKWPKFWPFSHCHSRHQRYPPQAKKNHPGVEIIIVLKI